MIAVLLALLVVVLGLALAAVMHRLPVSGMDDPLERAPYAPLPAGRLTDEDLDAVRFDQVLRGYRMTQVDEVLDRLRTQLRQQQAELSVLRAADADPNSPEPRGLVDDAQIWGRADAALRSRAETSSWRDERAGAQSTTQPATRRSERAAVASRVHTESADSLESFPTRRAQRAEAAARAGRGSRERS